MKKRSIALLMILIMTATLALSGCGDSEGARENNYPDGQISWIVPAPAGAFIDLPSRVANDNLDLGATVIIENIPGASQTIGTEEAASRKADGYTLLTAGNGAMNTQPILNGDLTYSPDDFVPVGLLSTGMQQMICVRADSEIKSYEDWKELVQGDERVTWTASNPGSVGHITASETLDQLDAENAVFVPYTGTAEVVQALLSGDVDFAVYEARNGKERSDAGEVTMIALLNGPVYQYAPEIPLVSEFGIEGIDRFAAWVWVVVHKDTPPDVVEFLREKFTEATGSDAYQDWLDENKFGRFDREYTMEDIENYRLASGEANSIVLKKLGMID